jgi:hypothetical protein
MFILVATVIIATTARARGEAPAITDVRPAADRRSPLGWSVKLVVNGR